MTAQHLLLLEFLRLRDEETTRRCVNELLARQRRGRALVDLLGRRARPRRDARVLRGAAPGRALGADDERLAAARRFCEERGGIGGARVFTRIWLALFGLWPWEEIPQLPPELVLLKPWLPLSVYDFALLGAPDGRRRSRSSSTTGRCGTCPRSAPATSSTSGPARRKPTLGLLSDRALALVRGPLRPAGPRARARLRRALDHRPAGARRLLGRDPAAVGVVADRARLPRPRPRVAVPAAGGSRAGSASSSRTATGSVPRRASRRSGTRAWRSSRLSAAGRARRRAGAAAGRRLDPAARRSGSAATGRCAGPGVEPGGWAFEYDNDLYPDIDDAADRRPRARRAGRRAAARSSARAAGWPACSAANGGWGAFDADNDADWLYRIPFCDFGAVIDPPSVDVTAHVVELLARRGGLRARPCAAGSTTCSASRRRTAPGSAAGASTTSTGPAPSCPALEAAGYPARPPGHAPRGRLARGAPERGRRLRRGLPLLRRRRGRPRVARPRRVDAVADGLGPDRPGGRRRGALRVRLARGRLAGRGRRSETAAGTSRTSPAPASRATSSSTTTSTGRSGRCWRSARPPSARACDRGARVKVYVTGATGFVGGHVARELRERGAEVRDERVDLLDRAGLERVRRRLRRRRPRRRPLQLRRAGRGARARQRRGHAHAARRRRRKPACAGSSTARPPARAGPCPGGPRPRRTSRPPGSSTSPTSARSSRPSGWRSRPAPSSSTRRRRSATATASRRRRGA